MKICSSVQIERENPDTEVVC